MRLLFDLESNGLLDQMDRIHCIVIYDLDEDQLYEYHGAKYIPDGIQHLASADELIGHNIIGFDIPAIQQAYPELELFPSYKQTTVTDTLIMSELIYTNLRDRDITRSSIPAKFFGRHGLEAWGHRLGFHKGDYAKEMKEQGLDPWAEYNESMLSYCRNDVELNVKLYKMFLKAGFSEQSIRLEHQVRAICNEQEAFGCSFNKDAALDLYQTLTSEREKAEASLIETFGSWWEGEEFTPKRSNKKTGYTEGVPLTKLKRIEFNPASRAHIAKRLGTLYGWKPKKFTPSGQAVVDESVLGKLKWPEAKLLTRYLLLQKRIGQIAEGKEAWLKLERNGRIHGRLRTNGAVTGRATHSRPNLAQVPAVRAPFGLECRSLFRATPGWIMVGADASGLELRCLAHYLARYDGGVYADLVLNGDIHTANQEAAGLPTRDHAKTFIYALLYGAGDGKIGQIVGGSANRGKALRAKFMRALPAFNSLTKGVKGAAAKNKKLKSLDGRYLHVRSAHSALNTLLQGAGAVIMKQAMVNFHDILQSPVNGLHHGDDYRQVLWVHDEFQVECRPELVEIVGEAMVEGIRMCTKQLDLGCPLDGEYKHGPSWAVTH